MGLIVISVLLSSETVVIGGFALSGKEGTVNLGKIRYALMVEHSFIEQTGY